jgi:nucleoid-associated protein YgaU
MKPGDSLTKLSQKFYGTKDSVRAIIRVNNFPNPDNVPIGARIKLP